MREGWQEALLAPITSERPCGDSLEAVDGRLLASLDAFRIFGQAKPFDSLPDQDPDGVVRDTWTPKPASAPEWIEIRDTAVEALGKSKDLRVLAMLGAAVLRTDGLAAFFSTLQVASDWLKTYWMGIYPLVEEDTIGRQNALNCFGDQMAVVDWLRKAPIVESRQHGRFALKDLEAVARVETSDSGASDAQIGAAFASMPLAGLVQLQEGVDGALGALRAIDLRMREADPEAVTAFDAVTAMLTRLGAALKARIAAHPETASVGAAAGPAGPDQAVGSGTAVVGGPVRSRQDAIKALDAVADFFRRTEPSSPIPLFVERAKRLVSKTFLEVLADVAPDGISQARSAGGVKEGE